YWEVPSTISLEALLKDKPPSFRWKKIDFFYHILHHITVLTEYADLDNNAAFVNISATYLQSFNHSYKQYLDYLIEQNIIVTDHYFIPGKKSTGYKISPLCGYGADILFIRVKDSICRRKMFTEKRTTHAKSQKEYPALTKWFNIHLSIARAGAIAKVDELFPPQTGGIRGTLRYHRQYARRPDAASKRLKALGAVNRFARKDFYYSIDETVGRFHSNLTNIKRELRHYITYNNQILVNIDIKSAQPFFSQLLLTEKFYETKAKLFSIHQFPSIINILTQSTTNNNSISHYMMLVKAVQKADIQEFMLYFNLVKSGYFYEGLHKILYPKEKMFNKGLFKQEVYRLLFSKNRAQTELKKRFKAKFPHTYNIFALYRRMDHTVMA
ncbi:MAG: hypothetical protein ACK42F_04865, partial [Sphingobacteriales bacterium]